MAIMTHLKGMVDDALQTVASLELDLNQLHKARAPENLDADGLVDFDREAVTNESRLLYVDKIVIT